MCGGCKMSRRTSLLRSYIFSGSHGSWIVCCLILQQSSTKALGGVSSVASIITTDEQLQ